MAIVFDGREFAKKKEVELLEKVELLRKKGITPKLFSIVVGDVDGAMKYQEMKKKAGERVGIEVEIKIFKENASEKEIEKEIERLNASLNVHGVMIQLPLPKSFSKEDREQLINAINPQKDVDGLREDSHFVAPVVKAVLEAIKASPLRGGPCKVAVVGAKGFEGIKMVRELVRNSFIVHGLDQEDSLTTNYQLLTADVVISCTGVPDLITGGMVKEGVIAIDVGAPRGDFDFESVSKKASFITSVPGGIGPVTIACLLENVVATLNYSIAGNSR